MPLPLLVLAGFPLIADVANVPPHPDSGRVLARAVAESSVFRGRRLAPEVTDLGRGDHGSRERASRALAASILRDRALRRRPARLDAVARGLASPDPEVRARCADLVLIAVPCRHCLGTGRCPAKRSNDYAFCGACVATGNLLWRLSAADCRLCLPDP